MKQFEMSIQLLLKFSILLIWFLGLGSVESCTSSRSFGDYRVVKKTDTDTDRVVVSLEEDTRFDSPLIRNSLYDILVLWFVYWH